MRLTPRQRTAINQFARRAFSGVSHLEVGIKYTNDPRWPSHFENINLCFFDKPPVVTDEDIARDAAERLLDLPVETADIDLADLIWLRDLREIEELDGMAELDIYVYGRQGLIGNMYARFNDGYLTTVMPDTYVDSKEFPLRGIR